MNGETCKVCGYSQEYLGASVKERGCNWSGKMIFFLVCFVRSISLLAVSRPSNNLSLWAQEGKDLTVFACLCLGTMVKGPEGDRRVLRGE